MMKKFILSAKLDFLINYSKHLYKDSKGLHLNSKDWEAFIHVGPPHYYDFLRNGTIEFFTKSKISGQTYRQPVKLTNFKRIESSLLLLFLAKVPEESIAKYISLFLNSDHVKLFCECPAFQFWGPHYNLTKMKSAYGPGEIREPNIRDKKRKNVVCKHLWLVLSEYNTLTLKIANGLIYYYKRFFGIASPTGVDRIKKTIGIKGMKKVIEQAIVDLNKINSNILSATFKQLSKDKLNDIFNDGVKVKQKPTKPEPVVEPKPEVKPEPKPEQKKIEPDSEIPNFTDEEIDDMINNAGALRSKKIKSKYSLI